MNKTNFFFPLLLLTLGLISNCGIFGKAKENTFAFPETILIDYLESKDLSENLNGLGSGDDEVLTIIYIADKKQGILARWESKYNVFTEKDNVQNIQQDIPIAPDWVKAFLVVILVEQDSKLEASQLASLVEEEISFELLPQINKVELQTKLGNDDLLEAKAIKLKLFFNKSSSKVRLKGIHLFDGYEYELVIRVRH